LSSCGSDSKNSSSSIPLSQPIFSAGAIFAPVTEAEVVIDPYGTKITAVKNQVLVLLNDDVTQSEVNSLELKIISLGCSVIGSNQIVKTVQVQVPATTSEFLIIDALKVLPGVNAAILNLFSSTQALLPAPAPVSSTFSGDYWIKTIQADKAWLSATGSSHPLATIGVIDSGIEAGQTMIDETRVSRFDELDNVIFDDDTKSLTNHGSFVIGLMAGYSNSAIGMAWTNKVVSVDLVHPDNGICSKIGSACYSLLQIPKYSLSEIDIALITVIKHGAKIVNISIAADANCSSTDVDNIKISQQFRLGLSNLIQYAKSKDTLIVFASGNHCTKNMDVLFESPNLLAEADWKSNTIIVAATDLNNKDYIEGNMGNIVDIAAPGVQVSNAPSLTPLDGTSFAAPLVTGTAGLVKGVNPTLVASEVKHIILKTGSGFPNCLF